MYGEESGSGGQLCPMPSATLSCPRLRSEYPSGRHWVVSRLGVVTLQTVRCCSFKKCICAIPSASAVWGVSSTPAMRCLVGVRVCSRKSSFRGELNIPAPPSHMTSRSFLKRCCWLASCEGVRSGFCECSLWGRGVTVTSVCCEWRRGPLEDFGRLALG